MSGVRIVDDDLRALGMTLPGFIERGKVIASLPSLGLLTVAARLPELWNLTYVEIDEFDTKAVLALEPDIVFVSSLSARVLDAYALCDALRGAGVPVVIGGLHASVMPEEAGQHATTVVIGEGEPVAALIATDFEAGRLRPRYGPVAHRFSADEPVPRYDLLDPDKYNRITVQTERGCPLDCQFCGASRLISAYKRKPADQIRRELDAVKQVWPKPFIELADDNTFVDKKHGREVAKVMRESGVRWFTETDISLADDPELLDILADSGCAQVLIGLESTSSESLALTDTKGWKRRRQDHYRQAIDQIQSRGISVNGCFVLGFDTDGPEVFERTRDFVRDSGITEVQVTLFTPFPGTAAYRQLKAAGRLLEPVFWDKCTLFDTTFQPLKMSLDEMRQGFRWLVAELYSPEATALRKTMFTSMVRGRHP